MILINLQSTVFGWAALEMILREEGMFACDDPNIECTSQTFMLNLIFTFGATTLMMFQLIGGPVVDKIGPRKSSILFLLLYVYL